VIDNYAAQLSKLECWPGDWRAGNGDRESADRPADAFADQFRPDGRYAESAASNVLQVDVSAQPPEVNGTKGQSQAWRDVGLGLAGLGR